MRKDIRGFNFMDNGLLLKLSDIHNIAFEVFFHIKYSIKALKLTNITTRNMLTIYNMKCKSKQNWVCIILYQLCKNRTNQKKN